MALRMLQSRGKPTLQVIQSFFVNTGRGNVIKPRECNKAVWSKSAEPVSCEPPGTCVGNSTTCTIPFILFILAFDHSFHNIIPFLHLNVVSMPTQSSSSYIFEIFKINLENNTSNSMLQAKHLIDFQIPLLYQ